MSRARPSAPDPAATYAFRLAGHLDDHWSARFDGGILARHDDGSTTLTAVVVDQAQLHGLLARIRDTGITLLELHLVRASGIDTTNRRHSMEISHRNLIRWAGLAALVAGVCYVAVGLFHPPNVAASVTSTRWVVVHVLTCAMCFLGLVGMAGLYVRQALKVGWLGLAGYVLISLWFVLILGFSFVEAFVLPHLATTTPGFVVAWMGMFGGSSGSFDLGVLPTVWTLTAPLYILGGVAFGVATFRAAVLPRWAGLLLALGTALAPIAVLVPTGSQPKAAIPVGLALIWLGHAVWSERQEQPTSAALRSQVAATLP